MLINILYVAYFFDVYIKKRMHVYFVHISYKFERVKYFCDMIDIFFMHGHRNMRVCAK